MTSNSARSVGTCRAEDCEGTLEKHPIKKYVWCRRCGWVVTDYIEDMTTNARRSAPRTPAERQAYLRRIRVESFDHDRYDKSGYMRLAGGYRDAYIAARGDAEEYAIDQYDDVSDGLWTPHDRSAAD